MSKPESRKRSIGILWWLFLTSMAVVVLPLVIFIFYQIDSTKRFTEQERLDGMKEWARLTSTKVDATITKRKAAVQSLAQIEELQTYLAGRERVGQDAGVKEILQALQVGGGYTTLSLLDEKGVCVASTLQELVGRDVSFRPYFRESAKGNVSFYMAMGLVKEDMGALFAAPIYKDDIFVGVLSVRIDRAMLMEDFLVPYASDTSRVILVTEDGVVMLSTDPALMLKSLSPLSDEARERLNHAKLSGSTEIESVGYTGLWQGIERGEDDIVRFANPAGVMEFAAVSTLQTNGWHIVVMDEAPVIMASAEKRAQGIEYAGLIACVTVLLACLVASRIISRPIRRICASFTQLRKSGYRDLHLAPEGPRELREMCLEFNLLAERVTSYHEKTEQQVTERTKELAEKVTQLEQSESRQRLIMENSPIGMMIINSDKEIVDINAAALSITGRKREDVIGHVCHEFVCPAERGKCPVVDKGECVDQSERVILNSNGEQVPILKSVAKVEINNKTYMLETFVDVRGRARAEAALRESEERYRSVVDNISIGVALISPEMKILSVNNQFKKWFPEADADKSPYCYQSFHIPSRDSVCTCCPTIKAFEDGKVHEEISETPMRGEIRNYRLVATPVTDKDGKVISVIEMAEDITERKRNDDEIIRAKEVAEKASRELAEKVGELERFNRLAVGREMMMIELKRQINKMCEKHGEKVPYDLLLIGAENGAREPQAVPSGTKDKEPS